MCIEYGVCEKVKRRDYRGYDLLEILFDLARKWEVPGLYKVLKIYRTQYPSHVDHACIGLGGMDGFRFAL
eukprot:1068680-Amorphochlora_amoeboformis.AAC.1